MLSKIYNVFETTEIQLTPQAIKRLRVTAILGLFALPLFAAAEMFNLSTRVTNILIGLGVISIISMLYSATTRMANRLWVPEKHLDEAEIERKRRSGSLTNQLILLALSLGCLTVLTLELNGFGTGEWWNGRVFTYLFGSLVILSTSGQIAIAAWMTEPISDPQVSKVAADKKYQWIATAAIIGVIAIAVLLRYLIRGF